MVSSCWAPGHRRWLWGVLLVWALSGCSKPAYLVGLARGQAKILAHKVPIADILKEPPEDLSEEHLARLRMVPEIKNFSARLGLEVEDLYSTYSPVRDFELWVVSASEKLHLESYLWRWPLVGSVPYKGFFSKEAAQKEMRALKARGLDVNLRSVPTYSTIGWFEDPVLPPMLRASEISFIGLLIHEAVHATIYRPDDAVFNEGVAAFIERKGVELFVREKHGISSETYQRYLKRERGQRAFLQVINSLFEELGSLYSQEIPEAEKLSRRQALFDRYLSAHANLQKRVEAEQRKAGEGVDLNNAFLLSYRIYFEEEEKFERLYRATGNDLKLTLELLTSLGRREGDPFVLIEEVLAELAGNPVR